MRVLLLVVAMSLTHVSGARHGVPAPVDTVAGEKGAPQVMDTAIEFAMVPRMETESPYRVHVGADGVGSVGFERDPANAAVPITVSQATWLRLERGAAVVDQRRCETKLKKIAKTGMKTISYVSAPSSPRSCSFDYSDDEGLMDTVAAFQAIVETLHYGERLQHEHRYDRLSLDAEMQLLTAEVAAGRAIELGNIGTMLRELVEDDRVIDRVRRAAARLLESK